MKSIVSNTINVRPFVQEDIPELLRLMRELALFEGYLDDFSVTEADIIERGIQQQQFYALVASRPESDKLLGMAVMYLVPYTFTLKPNMVLKELYIDETLRGSGVGSLLFSAVKDLGQSLGCGQLLWTVMAGNTKAEDFYSRHGAKPDKKWQGWSCSV